MVRSRKHHNNTGLRQIRAGKTEEQLKQMVKRIFKKKKKKKDDK